MTADIALASPPGGTSPRYIITSYDASHERWHTHRTHDIDDAAHAAEQLAERFGWADVWRAHTDLVVHYERVVAKRSHLRRSADAYTHAVSLATSRWYAAVATRDAGLADAAKSAWACVVQGPSAAAVDGRAA